MDEDFSKILYGLAAILFWLGPTLLRLLRKKKQAKSFVPKPQAKPRPEHRIASATDNDVLDDSFDDDSEDEHLSGAWVGELLSRVSSLGSRLDDVELSCKMHPSASPILPILATKCSKPLAGIKTRLASASSLTSHDADHLGSTVTQIERRLDALENVVSQRVSPDEGRMLKAFDTAIQDSLSPLLIHSRRMEMGLGELYGIGAFRHPKLDLESAQLSMVSVDPMLDSTPSMWAELASSSARTFFDNLKRGSGRAYVDLGLPDPESSIAYFLTTGRLSLAALASGWLPAIFADTVAALQMGPGFAASLGRYTYRGSDEESAITATIDARMRMGPLPNHLRMYIACIVLWQMGHVKESEDRFKSWDDSIGNPQSITLRTGRFSDMSLPTDRVLASIKAVVDGLLERPLTLFGGYPLSQIPGLVADEFAVAEMEKLARAFRTGATIDVRPVVVLSALALAVEADPQFERRIRTAAIAVLLGEAEAERTVAGALTGSSTALGELLATPDFWGQAVAVSTIFSRNIGGDTRFRTY